MYNMDNYDHLLKLARRMSKLSFQGQVLNWKWEPGETFPKEKKGSVQMLNQFH